MTTHLVWFRQDLRQHDNLALAAACRNSSARVLALYIATPRQWAAHNVSLRQAELINTQLNALQNALAEKAFLYCSAKWMTLLPVSKQLNRCARKIALPICFITISMR